MLHGSYAETTLTIFLPFCREDQVRKRVIQINWPCLFNNIRRSAPWKNIEKQLDLPAAFVKLSDGKRGLNATGRQRDEMGIARGWRGTRTISFRTSTLQKHNHRLLQ